MGRRSVQLAPGSRWLPSSAAEDAKHKGGHEMQGRRIIFDYSHISIHASDPLRFHGGFADMRPAHAYREWSGSNPLKRPNQINQKI